ncbi:MAG TPA: hypothetical protein VFP47_09755, partial [Pyrinomonadaceae bacterium]|nr:hypothetical protein [Pyrinomonadaceae bacterium]
PAEACKFCRARRKFQDQVIVEFQNKFRRRSVEMFFARQQPHEIRGSQELLDHFNAWQKAVSHKKAQKALKEGTIQ